ncbi:TPA: hypothetical protein ACU3A1_004693, partial [Salmonella enterica]
SPGAPVGTMQPSLLKSLSDEDSGSEDSGGANESDQTTTEPELNHMFGSIKGIDGIQSKELVFRRFTEEE